MQPQARLAAALTEMPRFVVGGAPCLDFANTVEPRGGPDPTATPVYAPGEPRRDYLPDYPHLLAWSTLVGLLPETDALRLLAAADAHPAAAAAALDTALHLRGAIFRAFLAIAHATPPDPPDLATLGLAYTDALANAQFIPTDGTLVWTWRALGPNTADDLLRPLWPVARSAIGIFTTGDPRRVKACPGVPGAPLSCLWLFYDTTKSRTRRWCTMADCGGHVKANRLTARRRAARSA